MTLLSAAARPNTSLDRPSQRTAAHPEALLLPIAVPTSRLTADSCRRAWKQAGFVHSDLEAAWSSAGRAWLAHFSGLVWEDGSHDWRVAPGKDRPDPSQDAYTAAQALDPAVYAAVVTGDRAWMDELASFYVLSLRSFSSTRLAGGKVVRVLSGPDAKAPECVLCAAQFLYPAARLLRAISAISAGDRTAQMRAFSSEYAPFIVREQVVRWIQTVNRNYWKATDLDSSYLAAWTELAKRAPGKGPRYLHAAVDTDLWITAIAGELLTAHAHSATVVPLTTADSTLLRSIRSKGVRLLASRATLHPETRDWRGDLRGSIDFFEGDFDGYPDLKYSADTGATVPSGPPRPALGISWDISHITRLPVVLVSLSETKQASDSQFPTARDLRLSANQFLYRAFTGDLALPQLRNYFDGTDGWYRVGYHGANFGYAPSAYCDSRVGNHPCLQMSGYSGWGRLTSFNEAVCEVSQSVASLALTTNHSARQLADRVLTSAGERFILDTARTSYPFRLFVLLADNANALR